MRIRGWHQTGESGIDVVQDIDFLLGLSLPARNATLDAGSVVSCDAAPESHPAPVYDPEVVGEIRELQDSVCDLKNEIRGTGQERGASARTAKIPTTAQNLISSGIRTFQGPVQ
jgi:hypothetical protein